MQSFLYHNIWDHNSINCTVPVNKVEVKKYIYNTSQSPSISHTVDFFFLFKLKNGIPLAGKTTTALTVSTIYQPLTWDSSGKFLSFALMLFLSWKESSLYLMPWVLNAL